MSVDDLRSGKYEARIECAKYIVDRLSDTPDNQQEVISALVDVLTEVIEDLEINNEIDDNLDD